MRLNRNKGQILILMAITLMSILLITTLAAVRTFKPISRDPEAAILLIKSQTRRAVLNSLAISSLSADTDASKFRESLQLQFRNIAAANSGVSIGVSDIQSLQFSWSGQNQGTTTATVKLRIVQSQYKLDWVETHALTLQLRVDALQRRPLEQFVRLDLNATLLMNGGPSLMKNPKVMINGTISYPCTISRNFGNGMYGLTVTVPLWTSATFTLIATDENGIRSECVFVPPPQ
jgi:hypothetical protein